MHDKWQVRSNITLDLGLRHEVYTPLVGYTPKGGQMTYDPDNNTVRVAGYGDVPENLGVKTYWKNFNPRTGISWRVNDSDRLPCGLRRERAAMAELLRTGLPDPADPAAHPRRPASRQPERWRPACRRLSSCRFPTAVCSMRRHCAAKPWPSCRPIATRAAALVERRLSAHPAGRIHG